MVLKFNSRSSVSRKNTTSRSRFIFRASFDFGGKLSLSRQNQRLTPKLVEDDSIHNLQVFLHSFALNLPPNYSQLDGILCCRNLIRVFNHDEEINDSPIEQVRLTVPITDDPTLPVLTFRTWVLGPITCVFLAVTGQLSSYRQFPVGIDTFTIQILFLLIGKLMAAKLPTKTIRVPGTRFTFSMNPGPFNIKEHALVTILASSGSSTALTMGVISVTKTLYHKNVGFWPSFMLVQTSQMIGYGFAGMFTKHLVDPPHMWWPYIMPDTSLYRVLHEVEIRPKGQLTRMQFFIIVSVSCFAYYIIPSYFFPSIMALSFVCWIWKDSVTAHQIGSGLHGLGIGSFSLDWLSISGYAGNPLIMPTFVILNSMAGFILITYIIAPIGYWINSHNAQRFPFISNDLFDVNGQAYNVSRVLSDDLTLDEQRYNNYPMYMSMFYIYATGFTLASEAATFTHFVLYHARDAWQQIRPGRGRLSGDVHNRLMKKYEPVPMCWFYTIIVLTLILSMLTSMFYGKDFQVPYLIMLLGYLLPVALILPVCAVIATTGQSSLDLYGLSQLIMGSIYPGKPIANLVFQGYVAGTLRNAADFLSDFKLAHYIKIPPRSMFIAQITGTFVSTLTHITTQWWILLTIENICDTEKLPEGSPWTCPFEHKDYAMSMIWGGLGPKRMFVSHSQFSNMYIYVIIGVIATVVTWALSRMLPEKKWIELIHIPLIFLSGINQPPAGAVNYWSSYTVAIFFNVIIYKKYKEWWSKYNYLLCSGLSVGITFMQLLLTWSLQMKGEGVYGLQWWGLEYSDHCHLAQCPTAPGIKVDGCPVFK